MIEEELAAVYGFETSHFREELDKAMLANPGKWAPYYHGTENEIAFKRKYSFSDRCRYYLPQENVKNALAKLLTNLKEHPVPLPLLSQYMPFQYTMVREGKLNNTPEDLIKARVMYTIEEYTYASHQEEFKFAKTNIAHLIDALFFAKKRFNRTFLLTLSRNQFFSMI